MTQKGSLVAADRMRFDISHPKAITPEELAQVEDDVNGRVRANSDVATRLMEPDAAVEAGAMALFGEKYGDEVRVVSMGDADADKAARLKEQNAPERVGGREPPPTACTNDRGGVRRSGLAQRRGRGA